MYIYIHTSSELKISIAAFFSWFDFYFFEHFRNLQNIADCMDTNERSVAQKSRQL